MRCTAINPADPGIMSKFDGEHGVELPGASTKDVSGGLNGHGIDGQSSPYSVSRSSTLASNLSKIGSAREVPNVNNHIQSERKKSSCSGMSGVLCGMFVYEDCREEQLGIRKDALFCTLCNAQVQCL